VDNVPEDLQFRSLEPKDAVGAFGQPFSYQKGALRQRSQSIHGVRFLLSVIVVILIFGAEIVVGYKLLLMGYSTSATMTGKVTVKLHPNWLVIGQAINNLDFPEGCGSAREYAMYAHNCGRRQVLASYINHSTMTVERKLHPSLLHQVMLVRWIYKSTDH
jgi:hypothetical protein